MTVSFDTSVSSSQQSVDQRRERNLKRTQWVLLAWQLSGLVAVLAYCSAFVRQQRVGFLQSAATTALLAGGVMFAGFIIGFLFGIPKTRQDQSDTTGATAPQSLQAAASPNT